MQKKIVMTFGTFDLLHPGHIYYLSEAKKLGEYLITVVARDSNVLLLKGKKPRETELQRLVHVKRAGISDEVILGSETDPYAIIQEKKPDILCFGYDQRSFNNERLTEFLKSHNASPEIVILPAFNPEIYKSSILNEFDN